MKRKAIILLVASWTIYYATGKGLIGGAMLLVAGIYTIVAAYKEWRKLYAGRKS